MSHNMWHHIYCQLRYGMWHQSIWESESIKFPPPLPSNLYIYTRTSGATGPLVLAPAEGMGALWAPCICLFSIHGGQFFQYSSSRGTRFKPSDLFANKSCRYTHCNQPLFIGYISNNPQNPLNLGSNLQKPLAGSIPAEYEKNIFFLKFQSPPLTPKKHKKNSVKMVQKWDKK